MYIRWKKQKRSTKVHGVYFLASGNNTHPQGIEKEAYLLSAYLVENVRVDGKPKQKILSYLGSINDAKITNPSANENFWESVDTHLRALSLKPDQKKDIKQKLQSRIPKIPPSELYKMESLKSRHPTRSRSKPERDQLEAFRQKYHLPGDDIRDV